MKCRHQKVCNVVLAQSPILALSLEFIQVAVVVYYTQAPFSDLV